MEKLQEFIEKEIKIRDMSIRAFALHCDISPGQMANVLNGNRAPGLSFLEKLARGTNTRLSAIVALIFPETTTTDPQIQILVNRIMALPASDREIVDSLILGLALKRKQQSLNNKNLDGTEDT